MPNFKYASFIPAICAVFATTSANALDHEKAVGSQIVDMQFIPPIDVKPLPEGNLPDEPGCNFPELHAILATDSDQNMALQAAYPDKFIMDWIPTDEKNRGRNSSDGAFRVSTGGFQKNDFEEVLHDRLDDFGRYIPIPVRELRNMKVSYTGLRVYDAAKYPSEEYTLIHYKDMKEPADPDFNTGPNGPQMTVFSMSLLDDDHVAGTGQDFIFTSPTVWWKDKQWIADGDYDSFTNQVFPEILSDFVKDNNGLTMANFGIAIQLTLYIDANDAKWHPVDNPWNPEPNKIYEAGFEITCYVASDSN